ncbi:MAG: WD40 repeat domain-containing protein [Gemmataceae bacterium]
MMRKSSCLRLARFVLLIGLSLALWQFSAAQQSDLPKNVLQVLKGHEETIYAVAVTPDGKYILTASFDNTIRLWDSKTGKEIKTFGGDKGHKDLVLCLGLSPDGRTFASGSQDNSAKVWDVPGDTHLKAYTHGDEVNGLALSNDGKLLAGAGKDGTVKLWNPADGKQLFNLTGHAGPVTGVSFSPDGKTLVSCGADQTLRVWNTADGKPLGSLYAHSGPATGVRYSPNGTVLTIGEDGLLKYWKLPFAPSRNLAAPHADVVTSMFLNGDTLITGSNDKTVRQWNFANGQLARQSAPASAPLADVALAPYNSLIAAGTADGNLVFWNPNDG